MRTMLKGKIHRARVTDANLDYEGSITIDSLLMEAADILPYEMVHVLDIEADQFGDSDTRVEEKAENGKVPEGFLPASVRNGLEQLLFLDIGQGVRRGAADVADADAGGGVGPEVTGVVEPVKEGL